MDVNKVLSRCIPRGEITNRVKQCMLTTSGTLLIILQPRQRVCASLLVGEPSSGMRRRTSLVCLGDAGVYSVLVAYTQLWDSGVA